MAFQKLDNIISLHAWREIECLLRLPSANPQLRLQLGRIKGGYRSDLRGGDADKSEVRRLLCRCRAAAEEMANALGAIATPDVHSGVAAGIFLTQQLRNEVDPQILLSKLVLVRDACRKQAAALIDKGGPKAKLYRSAFFYRLNEILDSCPRPPDSQARVHIAALLMHEAGDRSIPAHGSLRTYVNQNRVRIKSVK